MDTTKNTLPSRLFEILKDLIRIASPSGDEGALARHIASTYFADGWDVRVDEYANLVAVPAGQGGDLPLLTAHMDTRPVWGDDTSALLAEEDIISLEGRTVTKNHPIQCGFDDKAGIAIILALKERLGPRFKVLLTTQEETGGAGVAYALADERNLGFFAGVPFAFTIDRHSTRGSEIIHTYAGLKMCSDRYVNEIEAISASLGAPMKGSDRGTMADCYQIAEAFPIPIVNLSCGFMDEHTPKETLDFARTLDTFWVVERCLREQRRFTEAARWN
jgi:putative aminopeptidase FrvX